MLQLRATTRVELSGDTYAQTYTGAFVYLARRKFQRRNTPSVSASQVSTSNLSRIYRRLTASFRDELAGRVTILSATRIELQQLTSVGVVHAGGVRDDGKRRRWWQWRQWWRRRRGRELVLLDLLLAEEEVLVHFLLARRLRQREHVLVSVLLQVVLEGERPTVRRAAHVAAELEIVVLLVRLDVRADGVERRERSRALGAPERLRVAVLVAGQLHPRLERLRAVRARVGALVAVRQQVMVVDGGRLEALAAVLTGVRPHACVRAHVEGQAVGHAKGLAAYLTSMRLLPGVNSFVLDFLVRSGEPAPAMLALIRFLAVAGFRR